MLMRQLPLPMILSSAWRQRSRPGALGRHSRSPAWFVRELCGSIPNISGMRLRPVAGSRSPGLAVRMARKHTTAILKARPYGLTPPMVDSATLEESSPGVRVGVARVWRLERPGGPLRLIEGAIPQVRAGTVRIRMEAVPILSYLGDYISGKLPYDYPPGPFTPGTNGIGRVEEVGEDVSHLTP